MRSRLTTLLAAGFLCAGTGAALAFVSGEHFGIKGNDARSAAVAQYGCEHGNGVGANNECNGHQGEPPGKSGEAPPGQGGPPRGLGNGVTQPTATPPASQFAPAAPKAKVSSRGGVTIQCSTACHIVLRFRHGKHRVHVSRALKGQGTATLHLSKKQLRGLGHGKVLVTVEVNGKVIAHRTIRF